MNFLPIMAITNKLVLIPIAIMVAIMLCSPAIQLNLSTKKNKYVGLIFPVIVFVFFLIISIVAKPGIVLSLLMTLGAPAALIAFHIIIRKNLRY